MNKLILVTGVALLIGSVFFLNYNQIQSADMIEESTQNFVSYKISQNKKYSSISEESYRLAVYTENMRIAQAHNADPTSTWTMGETQFSDLTQQEFAAIYLTQKTSDIADDVEVYEDSNFTSNGGADWRTQPGVSTHVKNQGQCGSCWAFSTVGAVEAYFATVKGQKNLDLSEQQLVDCSRGQNQGCQGGWPYVAISYVVTYGLTTQSAYAYTGKDGGCKVQGGPYKVSKAVKVGASQSSLQSAIQQRPVSVCVDASNWSQYRGGVLSQCGTQTNHAVLAFGYDQGYWLIKNSWGTGWGESGFIRIKDGNTCNVLTEAYLAA